jgi:hypothetical protein
VSKELRVAEQRLEALMREIFTQITPWQRVQLARHPNRPIVNHYLELLFTDVTELHGDRYFRDDPAIVTALARIGGRRVMVVGHRKGRDVKEKVACHFGSPEPEGYRKALRKMKLAERFGLPVVALIDTQGAYPGIGAEERGQAWAIAENIQELTGLRVPIVVAVVGGDPAQADGGRPRAPRHRRRGRPRAARRRAQECRADGGVAEAGDPSGSGAARRRSDRGRPRFAIREVPQDRRSPVLSGRPVATRFSSSGVFSRRN